MHALLAEKAASRQTAAREAARKARRAIAPDWFALNSLWSSLSFVGYFTPATQYSLGGDLPSMYW